MGCKDNTGSFACITRLLGFGCEHLWSPVSDYVGHLLRQ